MVTALSESVYMGEVSRAPGFAVFDPSDAVHVRNVVKGMAGL